jgi:type III restriction enzyme
MQARVNPSAIIEFTATPRLNSNILHSVTAQELKLEEMIKLPIMLSEHDTWQNAVNGAIASRASLAEEAEKDTAYIRPIVLFQAQPKNQEVTVEVLKKHLMEVEQIPEYKIAVATGDQRELDGINLFDPKCPIEYVITVEALKEGWDCSFAYAFCSVSRIQSAVDVEQLLGRVLRMPYAKRRKAEDLNRAYAFLSEPSFGEAARSLADKLVAMGFEEDEALDNIEPAQTSLDADTGLFGPRDKPKPTFKHTVTATPEVVAELKKREGVSVRETDDGKVEIAVTGRVDGGLERAIVEALPETERTGFSAAVTKYRVEVQNRARRSRSLAWSPRSRASSSSLTPTCSWNSTTGRCSTTRRNWLKASSRSARRRAASRSTSTATASPTSSRTKKNNWRSTSMSKGGHRRRWCSGSTGRCANRTFIRANCSAGCATWSAT